MKDSLTRLKMRAKEEENKGENMKVVIAVRYTSDSQNNTLYTEMSMSVKMH